MKHADEIRVITNSSQASFNHEIEKIEADILQAAHDGRSRINTQVQIEIAQRVRDLFCINGYRVVNNPGSSQVEISW